MPSIKKYERKNNSSAAKPPLSQGRVEAKVSQRRRINLKSKKSISINSDRKRPWEDSISVEETTSNAVDNKTEIQNSDVPSEATTEETQQKTHHNEEAETKTWTFFGDEWLKAQKPEVYQWTQCFLNDWTSETPTFSAIETKSTVMNWALKQSLTKAKKIETKLEEKGVFALIKMGVHAVKAEVEKRKSRV